MSMSVVPTIDVGLVRWLVAEQFPQWSQLDIRPVDADGWDNRSFRLGDVLSVRLPSAAAYASQVAKEVQWLPVLADALRLPTPEVVGVGVPDAGYPFPWTIRRWIEGTTLADATGIDGVTVAADLARFLRDLHDVEPPGPAPGPHSAGRGAPLHQWDEQTRKALAALQGRIKVSSALRLWQDVLDAHTATERTVWFHGDVAPGNLLVCDGRLSAVIDFGLAGVGDPSCDLAIAWTWFDEDERETFRAELGADERTWLRGKGWALWKALISLDHPRHATESEHALRALGVLHGHAFERTTR
jgi:aminoglycoside phosphotransferase (APT) family kinase protein